MVVRREGDRLRRYLHLGTGNYHPGTSRAYTDLGLLTCDETLGQDMHAVFTQLTGLGRLVKLDELLQSPFTLHKRVLELIDHEAAEARAGRPAQIQARMNSLTEPAVIRALYRASQAGVTIQLLVRGVCRLRPGVPGVSENIELRSVVGRFLEHSRVFRFHHGGEDLVFCGSADWMERNLRRRVEVVFPIRDPALRARVITRPSRLRPTTGRAGSASPTGPTPERRARRRGRWSPGRARSAPVDLAPRRPPGSATTVSLSPPGSIRASSARSARVSGRPSSWPAGTCRTSGPPSRWSRPPMGRPRPGRGGEPEQHRRLEHGLDYQDARSRSTSLPRWASTRAARALVVPREAREVGAGNTLQAGSHQRRRQHRGGRRPTRGGVGAWVAGDAQPGDRRRSRGRCPAPGRLAPHRRRAGRSAAPMARMSESECRPRRSRMTPQGAVDARPGPRPGR